VKYIYPNTQVTSVTVTIRLNLYTMVEHCSFKQKYAMWCVIVAITSETDLFY